MVLATSSGCKISSGRAPLFTDPDIGDAILPGEIKTGLMLVPAYSFCIDAIMPRRPAFDAAYAVAVFAPLAQREPIAMRLPPCGCMWGIACLKTAKVPVRLVCIMASQSH